MLLRITRQVAQAENPPVCEVFFLAPHISQQAMLCSVKVPLPGIRVVFFTHPEYNVQAKRTTREREEL